MTTYKNCRALTRGLDILQMLSIHGSATPAQLAKLTGVHRTTVYRLLETLRESGYVEKRAIDEGYRLAIKVRRLSDGYTDDSWIVESASKALRDLQKTIVWPTDISVLSHDRMVIRESSHRYSPFSIHRAVIGNSWPVMTSASGRAHLAFCDDTERENLIFILGRSEIADNNRALEAPYVNAIVAKTRERGYAESVSECEEKISAISIPVQSGNRVLGVMTTVFFTSTLAPHEAARLFLPPMRKALDRILTELEANSDTPLPSLEPASRPFAQASLQ
ncbi:helix-turn-helix domain-containing protein [Pararhodobacter oceanensis]|uniref:helix-turn-helix domain-containing protein n=1 Tax=Pararhodobacter oceanensis TaxID=2172121 RepID=UPI003A94F4D8